MRRWLAAVPAFLWLFLVFIAQWPSLAQEQKEKPKEAILKVAEPQKEEKEAKKEDKKEEAAKAARPKKQLLPAFIGGAAKAAPPTPAPDQATLDQQLFDKLKVASDVPSMIQLIEGRTPNDSQQKIVEEKIARMGNDSFAIREAATQELEKIGPVCVAMLRKLEGQMEPEAQRRALRLIEKMEATPTRMIIPAACRRLATLKAYNAIPNILRFIPFAEDDANVQDIRTAILPIAYQNGQPEPVLWEKLNDPDRLVRLFVFEIFAQTSQPDVRKQIRDKALAEKDSEIKLRSLIPLIQLSKDKSLVPVVIDQLGELSADKAWRAEEMLFRLAGEKGPMVSLGTDEESRKKARDAWKSWWEANQTTIAMERLDQGEQLLGYTLSIELDNAQQGRVVEYGPDQKIRWAIKGNLQYPTDAIIMPDDKVLIAEQNSSTVSLYDIKTSKKIWTEQVYQPVSLQRLNNGNILVGCRNQIFEWEMTGDKRKMVNVYDRSDFHDISYAMKLNTGDYLFLSTQGATGRMFRVDPKTKKVVKEFGVGQIYYWATFQLIPGNKILVTQRNGVAEYDLESAKLVHTTQIAQAYFAQKLPNGNLLVSLSNARKISEVTRDGKEVSKQTLDNNYRPNKAKRR